MTILTHHSPRRAALKQAGLWCAPDKGPQHFKNHRADENDDIPYCHPVSIGYATSNKNDHIKDNYTQSTASANSSYPSYYSSSAWSSCPSGTSSPFMDSSKPIATTAITTSTPHGEDYLYCRRVLSQNEKLFKAQSKIEKHKTELCQNYLHHSTCKHGAKCVFAHGKDELRLTTLIEREQKGLIDDIETFMTRPCHHFVSTGDCPFGKRCSSIHDPRVAGSEKFWLPHCALMNSKKIKTEVHVEWYGHATFSPIHHGHPFGPMFPVQISSISGDDFLAIISNKKEIVPAAVTPKGRRAKMAPTILEIDYQKPPPLLSHRQRLFIARKMRHDFTDLYKYKFRPSHVIFDEVCMVVQTRAFYVSYGDRHLPSQEGQMIEERDPEEIDLANFNAENENHTIVREIAFGPFLSPSDRHLALFFDISDKDVHPLAPDQQNKCRRTINFKLRKELLSTMNLSSESSGDCGAVTVTSTRQQQEHLTNKRSAPPCKTATAKMSSIPIQESYIKRVSPTTFDDDSALINRPFKLCTPKDKSCYLFVTELLESCYKKSKVCSGSNKCYSQQNNCCLDAITMTKSEGNTFKSLVDHFAIFHLPANSGRDHINKNTPVPKPGVSYNIPSLAVPIPVGKKTHRNGYHPCSRKTRKTKKIGWQETCKAQIWESFIETAAAGFTQLENDSTSVMKRGGKCSIFNQIRSCSAGKLSASGAGNQVPSLISTTNISDDNPLPHIWDQRYCGQDKSSNFEGRKQESPDTSDDDFTVDSNEDSSYYKQVLPFCIDSDHKNTTSTAENIDKKQSTGWCDVKAYYGIEWSEKAPAENFDAHNSFKIIKRI